MAEEKRTEDAPGTALGEAPIQVGVVGASDRRRRRREAVIAAVAAALTGLLTWVELKSLGVDSYLFIALFNVNLILLALLVFLVFRNGVKLMLERRRAAFGSRLKSRLAVAFITLSLAPTLVMFLVALKFVQTSTDYWFKSAVEESLDSAVALGQSYRDQALERVRRLAESSAALLASGELGAERLESVRRAGGLAVLAALDEAGGIIASAQADPADRQDWTARELAARLSLSETRARGFVFALLPGGERDGAAASLMLPPDAHGRERSLVLVEDLGAGGAGSAARLTTIAKGAEEFKKLKALKRPLKVALYVILLIMTLLIVFSAMWSGFRLARELSAPVQALAAGVTRVASGDYRVRLEDQSADELGVLVRAFNRMAGDLDRNSASLTRAREALEAQNLELEARRGYIEAVLDNIAAGVASVDGQGRLTTLNLAAEALLGAREADLAGRVPRPDADAPAERLLAEIFERPGSPLRNFWRRDARLTVDNRELSLLVHVAPLALAPGASGVSGAPGADASEKPLAGGLVAVIEDVTELEEARRMAAWREVARRVAHEIKNPLTPIKLSAQRLEKRFGEAAGDPVFAQCVETIVRHVEHMQNMVGEFSAFAKLPEVTPVPGDLAPLVREAATLFQSARPEVDWRVELPEGEVRAAFDAEAIRRMLMNLLTNALESLDGSEYAPGRPGMERPGLRLCLERDAARGTARLTVEDNGRGLTAHERARVFEPYFSRKKGNAGLGLTIVKSIVAGHDGRISVRDARPRGAAFVVELALTPEARTDNTTSLEKNAA